MAVGTPTSPQRLRPASRPLPSWPSGPSRPGSVRPLRVGQGFPANTNRPPSIPSRSPLLPRLPSGLLAAKGALAAVTALELLEHQGEVSPAPQQLTPGPRRIPGSWSPHYNASGVFDGWVAPGKSTGGLPQDPLWIGKSGDLTFVPQYLGNFTWYSYWLSGFKPDPTAPPWGWWRYSFSLRGRQWAGLRSPASVDFLDPVPGFEWDPVTQPYRGPAYNFHPAGRPVRPVYRPHPGVGVWLRPGLAPAPPSGKSPPGREQKRYAGNSVTGAIIWGVGHLTEFLDFWNALLEASDFTYNYWIGGSKFLQQLDYVLSGGLSSLRYGDALKNLLENALEDMVFGKLSSGANRKWLDQLRRYGINHRPVGIGAGPAM